MPNRRDFLRDACGAAAGVVFCGCNILAAPQAATQSKGKSATRSGRRQVMVGGRRVKTVDVHAHCTIPEATALMAGQPGAAVAGPGSLVMGPERLRMMDEQGIDMEALSINPTWYATDRELAARIIRIQNEKLAELCAAQPDRFVAFATVALQHPDLAAQQLEEGIKKLGLRGGSIGASVNGEELSARRFDPF